MRHDERMLWASHRAHARRLQGHIVNEMNDESMNTRVLRVFILWSITRCLVVAAEYD